MVATDHSLDGHVVLGTCGSRSRADDFVSCVVGAGDVGLDDGFPSLHLLGRASREGVPCAVHFDREPGEWFKLTRLISKESGESESVEMQPEALRRIRVG